MPIERNPNKDGRAEALIAGTGIEVWLIIDLLQHADYDRSRVPEDYDLTAGQFAAAVAYYLDPANKPYVDARILLHYDQTQNIEWDS